MEVEIIGHLLEDLNNFMALDLQPVPDYNREVERIDISALDSTTFILIGGSHALNTAHGLSRTGRKAIAATVGGWRPTPELMPVMLRKIERALEMCPDKENCVAVLQLYDNCFYYSRTEDGNMVHSKKGKDDKHHVIGESVIAPKEMQYISFKQTLPLLDAVKDLRKVFLSPMPRYWDSPCCEKPGHVTNRLEEGYKKNLENAVHESKENIRAFCFRHSVRNCRVVNSWQLLKKLEKVWTRDPVHLSDLGYEELAFGVAGAAEELLRKRPADSPLGNASKVARFSADTGDSGPSRGSSRGGYSRTFNSPSGYRGSHAGCHGKSGGRQYGKHYPYYSGGRGRRN